MNSPNQTSDPRPPARVRTGRQQDLHLLWPPGSNRTANPLNPAAAHDLGLDSLLPAFSPDSNHQKEIRPVLNQLIQDPTAIRYRQDILADLLEQPQLVRQIEEMMPAIDALGRFSFQRSKEMTTLHEVTWRMGELQSIVDCVQGLAEVFQAVGGRLKSQGLHLLQEEIARTQSDPDFQNLVRELPEMLGRLRTCASITIGVNLDQYLRPVEATLLAVNEEKFTHQSILNRLFGGRSNSRAGIAPLHSVPHRTAEGPYALPVDSELGWAVEPTMVPLFKDLAEVIEKITQPISQELRRYSEIQSRTFTNLRQDLIFYLGAVRFIRRLESHGLPVCRPEIAPQEERSCEAAGAYNPNLALHLSGAQTRMDLSEAVVRNDLRFGPQGRILILTGPNQGGKTTYIQAAGLLQVLAQVGLYAPAAQARLSPVDQIFTHFPLEERLDAGTGRFGDEARRLGEIFQAVTQDSLVLLNESLSSTSAGESLYLAQDVVRILRRIGARAIYSTHLHELAASAAAINADTPGGSRVLSLVASPVAAQAESGEDIRRSYKIEARPPLGRSYAREIAVRYGIGYDQLEKILTERGVLAEGRG